KQNRIYYSKPRSEMGVTCSGRQKQRGKSIPAYYD
ncbi:TPA: regulator, partial [Escherichia coli]|nr:regulator [Escherichia coli]